MLMRQSHNQPKYICFRVNFVENDSVFISIYKIQNMIVSANMHYSQCFLINLLLYNQFIFNAL